MIVPDINLLVYAYNNSDRHHTVARRWWEGLVNGTETIGLPWVVMTGFVRIMTHPGILTHPASPAQAMGYVRDWLRYGHITPLNPGLEHLALLQQNLAAAGAGADLVPDAHIAALAMEHQAEVHSNDSDFGRFPGLQWHNPL